MTPLQELAKYDQAPWRDFIRRSLITSGLTSNPAVFSGNMTPNAIDEALAVPDIQDDADVLRPVYDSSQAHDGYISLECSPYNARNTQAAIFEARRLFKTATDEGTNINLTHTTERKG